MELDLSWAGHWAGHWQGAVGTGSDQGWGDKKSIGSACVNEAVSTCVEDAGDNMVAVAGGEVEAMEVLRCRCTGWEGSEMYGRDEAAGCQRYDPLEEHATYNPDCCHRRNRWPDVRRRRGCEVGQARGRHSGSACWQVMAPEVALESMDDEETCLTAGP